MSLQGFTQAVNSSKPIEKPLVQNEIFTNITVPSPTRDTPAVQGGVSVVPSWNFGSLRFLNTDAIFVHKNGAIAGIGAPNFPGNLHIIRIQSVNNPGNFTETVPINGFRAGAPYKVSVWWGARGGTAAPIGCLQIIHPISNAIFKQVRVPNIPGVSGTSGWIESSVTFIAPSSGTIKIRVLNDGSTTGGGISDCMLFIGKVFITG